MVNELYIRVQLHSRLCKGYGVPFRATLRKQCGWGVRSCYYRGKRLDMKSVWRFDEICDTIHFTIDSRNQWGLTAKILVLLFSAWSFAERFELLQSQEHIKH